MTEQPRKLVNTVRFVVVAADGRRSAEWRVWTGEKKKVTDELYLAPRKRAGEFKYSLHSSNYSQLGYVERARDRLRPGDRHAIDRWELSDEEVMPNWRVALGLWFPESELRYIDRGSMSADVIEVPAAPVGRARAILILVGTSDASLAGLDLVAVLDRASGGRVAIVHLPTDLDPDLVPALHAREAHRIPLQIPGIEAQEPFTWELVPGRNGKRLVIEFTPDERPPGLPPIPPFRGAVLPWSEIPEDLPAQYREFNLACGLLVYGRDDTSRLYVDQRARCDHQHLGQECQDLCDAVDRGHIDGIWKPLVSGELHRIISTRAVLLDAGIDPDNPHLPAMA